MREIKFRAWDKNLKVMISPYCELRDGRFWGEDCTNTGISIQHEHVMQFTGLLDRNGNEIYEGDINQDKGECFYNLDDASFCWQYPSGEVYQMDDENKWCEIIGNKYEHPNLIQ